MTTGNSPAFNQFGPAGFQQQYLGPRDINSPITDSLLSGFDPKRLLGISPPLPASLATIPASVVTSLPHYNGAGCSQLGIVTTDRQRESPIPSPPASIRCPVPLREATDRSPRRDALSDASRLGEH